LEKGVVNRNENQNILFLTVSPPVHSNETIVSGGGSDILRLIILKKTTRHNFEVISSECWEKYKLFLLLLSGKPKIIIKTKRY